MSRDCALLMLTWAYIEYFNVKSFVFSNCLDPLIYFSPLPPLCIINLRHWPLRFSSLLFSSLLVSSLFSSLLFSSLFLPLLFLCKPNSKSSLQVSNSRMPISISLKVFQKLANPKLADPNTHEVIMKPLGPAWGHHCVFCGHLASRLIISSAPGHKDRMANYVGLQQVLSSGFKWFRRGSEQQA